MYWGTSVGLVIMGAGVGGGIMQLLTRYHYPEQWKKMLEIDNQRSAIRKESRRQRKAVR